MKINGFVKPALFVVACEMAGLVGTAFTANSLAVWYLSLRKPAFNPPGWIFGPVWVILYALMGVSAYIIWSKGLQKQNVRIAMWIFVLQLALNILWTAAFFGLKSILFGFATIVALLAAIILTIILFYKISKKSALLLVPYLFWVSFALVLNLSILLLNG
ncbi:MAG: tryptophan-rich sensory protein [Candidatus Micrarchaeota archaeon]|nr:tryptophan-rich sensory protein [Candidatus Micrarchaeota archaeon]